jgi:hypothetical protein
MYGRATKETLKLVEEADGTEMHAVCWALSGTSGVYRDDNAKVSYFRNSDTRSVSEARSSQLAPVNLRTFPLAFCHFAATSQTLIFLRLPQVDEECRDQIRNKWVAASCSTANTPISMTAIAGIIPIKPEREPIRVPDQNSKKRVADILALRGVWPKCAFLKVSRTRYVYLNNLKLLQSWRICIVSKFK